MKLRKTISFLAVLAGLALLVVGSPARAQIVFDFESVLPVLSSNPTTVSSVTQTVSGLTVTIYRTSGADIDVWDLSGLSGPASWGSRSLGTFIDLTDDYLVANFSAPVGGVGVSVEFGDYGADFDGTVLLEAFSGLDATGSSLGSASSSWGSGDFFFGDSPGTIGVAASGIRSIRFKGGSVPFPQSLFWDNLTVQQQRDIVPEPGALAMLAGLGVAGVGLLFRRRR